MSKEIWIGLGTGIVAGLLTGYLFYLLASKSGRRDKAQLETQLATMRSALVNAIQEALQSRQGIGASAQKRLAPPLAPPEALQSMVYERARDMQMPDGSIDRLGLTAHFLAANHHASDVESAINALISSGKLRAQGDRLVMQ